MSAAAQTKIFGIRVGLDPKILVGALVAVAGILFWYNSRSEDAPSAGVVSNASAPAAVSTNAIPFPAAAPSVKTSSSLAAKRRVVRDDRGTLRLRPVDATRGDIDPVLRLNLLDRLQNVKQATNSRNIFESGPSAAVTAQLNQMTIPKIKPGPLRPPTVAPMVPTGNPMAVNIPLKYYGFVKPLSKTEPNRGFFMNGEDILVASEGDLLEKRYLVVMLTAGSAKLEDTQIKQGQTLPVVPEATEQQ